MSFFSVFNFFMAASTPTCVSFSAFAVQNDVDWLKFEKILGASIFVVHVPKAQKQRSQYLHLHIDRKTLNFFSNRDEAAVRIDLQKFLQQF